MRYGWLTDIHLEFMGERKAQAFVEDLAEQELDGLFLSGDISTAARLDFHLQLFEKTFQRPVYFVLGNHDYYGMAIEEVRKKVKLLTDRSEWLYWLPCAGIVELAQDTCLIGHGSWADGRLGNYAKSKVILNDYIKIPNFAFDVSGNRLSLLNRLGDEAAAYLEKILPEALARYAHIIVLVHVPPFREACWHQGEISDDNFLPHFACKAVGDVLHKVMIKQPDRQMTVLCGHTHSKGYAEILPNLQVKTGMAEYGKPVIQEIIKIGGDAKSQGQI